MLKVKVSFEIYIDDEFGGEVPEYVFGQLEKVDGLVDKSMKIERVQAAEWKDA